MDLDLILPDDLLIGVATSSWQIEGSVHERGRCIWDDFATVPGAIADGATGEPACDHVKRLQSDLDLITWLGVDAYRFSVSWPRVLPEGRGKVSGQGMDFYDRLVDGLLERGVAPYLTLYHWDLPSSLQREGGWTNRRVAHDLADYASLLARRLGDRIVHWATLNEPWCAAFLGHASGHHAPGMIDGAAAFAAAHHLMLGHGLAVDAIRAEARCEVGIVLNLIPTVGVSAADSTTAHHVHLIHNQLFLDTLRGSGPPPELVAATSSITDWSFIRDGDNQVTSAPIDWLGENYYTVQRVSSLPPGEKGDESSYPGATPFRFAPRRPVTDMDWEIIPAGLVDALQMAASSLPGLPLYVTENGAAVAVVSRGTGPDPDEVRRRYLSDHIFAILDARSSGLPVNGYFAWSLLDNLEWSYGWSKQFGLVQTGPDDLTRRPKASAVWLRDRLRDRQSRAGRYGVAGS